LLRECEKTVAAEFFPCIAAVLGGSDADLELVSFVYHRVLCGWCLRSLDHKGYEGT